MAAGDSSTSICNIALIALGEDPIKSLTDNNTRAIVCNARYESVRRFTLRSHPWNCAKKQASIPASATGPLFKWTSKFPLPADFIRFYSESSDYDMAIWDIMADPDTGQQCVYSNETGPLDILYVYDLQDTTRMDPVMTHVIAYNLIVLGVGMKLTQNQSRVSDAKETLKGTYDIGRFIGAQESAPREWDVDILLRSRN